MKKVGNTLVPRLPKEARAKLGQGSAHKNKMAYSRKDKHKKNKIDPADEQTRPQFFIRKLDILYK